MLDGTTALVLALMVVAFTSGCAADQQIERPMPLYGEVSIDYPLELWDSDVEGETLLRVRVTDMGRVDSAVVLESSGHELFDSAAIEGALELRPQQARAARQLLVKVQRLNLSEHCAVVPLAGTALLLLPLEPLQFLLLELLPL